MDRYDMISSLHNWRKDWKIGVKLQRSWEMFSVFSGRFMILILADPNCDKIQAKISDNLIDKFVSNLKEETWVSIENFDVVAQRYSQIHYDRNTINEWEILFNEKTVVTPIPELRDGLMVSITPINDIICYKIKKGRLIYDVGDLTWWNNDPYRFFFRQKMCHLKFRIKDIEGFYLNCIAFGDMAIEFSHAWTTAAGTTVIGVLTAWHGHYNDNLGILELRSSGSVSQFFFNPDITEVHAFKNSIGAIKEKELLQIEGPRNELEDINDKELLQLEGPRNELESSNDKETTEAEASTSENPSSSKRRKLTF